MPVIPTRPITKAHLCQHLLKQGSHFSKSTQRQNILQIRLWLPVPRVLCCMGKTNSPHLQVVWKGPWDFMKLDMALQRWSRCLWEQHSHGAQQLTKQTSVCSGGSHQLHCSVALGLFYRCHQAVYKMKHRTVCVCLALLCMWTSKAWKNRAQITCRTKWKGPQLIIVKMTIPRPPFYDMGLKYIYIFSICTHL